MHLRRSWDPLYGRMDFTDFEYGLLMLPEVQRLRYVRMCNINSMLVTGASDISRFEHTIGVLYLTKRWVQKRKVPESEARDIVAAAVLHDMQTGPFGHSMQYVLEDNESDSSFVHEDLAHGWQSSYHQQVAVNASFGGKYFGAESYLKGRWEKVAAIIRGEGIYGPLIAGTMDLDNIDNVVRLAYHVGVANSADARIAISLAESIGSDKGKITLPSSMVPVVQRWQEIRSALYKLLLLDWAEFSAKAMLTKAMERAAEFGVIGADSWIRTDLELLEVLEKNTVGEAQEVKDLVSRLKRGDLYSPIDLLTSSSIDQYSTLSSYSEKRSIENSIQAVCKGKGQKFIVHYILDNRKTGRKIEFIDDIKGNVVSVGSDTRQLLVGLFSSMPMSSSEVIHIRSQFREILRAKGVDNIAELDDPMGSAPHSQVRLL